MFGTCIETTETKVTVSKQNETNLKKSCVDHTTPGAAPACALEDTAAGTVMEAGTRMEARLGKVSFDSVRAL